MIRLDNGVGITAEAFNLNQHKVSYWKKKIEDPTYHPGKQGGAQKNSYILVDRNTEEEVKMFIYQLVATPQPEIYLSRSNFLFDNLIRT